jgi:hypothetical protein
MKNRFNQIVLGFLVTILAIPAFAGVTSLKISSLTLTGVKDSLITAADPNVNDVTGSTGSVLADPELTFFPKKISQKDILVIIRKNNETANVLKYVIKAGNITLNGNFKGSKAEMKAYINLADQLKELTDLDKINVVITDNSGNSLVNTDIPLVTIDQD